MRSLTRTTSDGSQWPSAFALVAPSRRSGRLAPSRFRTRAKAEEPLRCIGTTNRQWVASVIVRQHLALATSGRQSPARRPRARSSGAPEGPRGVERVAWESHRAADFRYSISPAAARRIPPAGGHSAAVVATARSIAAAHVRREPGIGLEGRLDRTVAEQHALAPGQETAGDGGVRSRAALQDFGAFGRREEVSPGGRIGVLLRPLFERPPQPLALRPGDVVAGHAAQVGESVARQPLVAGRGLVEVRRHRQPGGAEEEGHQPPGEVRRFEDADAHARVAEHVGPAADAGGIVEGRDPRREPRLRRELGLAHLELVLVEGIEPAVLAAQDDEDLDGEAVEECAHVVDRARVEQRLGTDPPPCRWRPERPPRRGSP